MAKEAKEAKEAVEAVEFINKVHNIVYDECYSLSGKDAQKVATDISKFSMRYFLMRISDGIIYDIVDIRMISKYLLQLQNWPFDDFKKHVKLLKRYNIVIDVIDEEIEEYRVKVAREKAQIIDNLISMIKNMDQVGR